MVVKRAVLSAILSLSLLCTGIYNVSAEDDLLLAEGQEISEEKQEVTVQKVPENIEGLVQALGLMDAGETGSAGFVTRGYAAEVLLRFEKVYAEGKASGSIYLDVDVDTPYAFAIETASACGYFFGTGDGKFSPDANMTPAQMATVLLRLAGYPDSAIASSTEFGKLQKNIGNYEYLTYYGLANMLYNFLDINIIMLGGNVSTGNPKYTKSSTETVLDNCLDVEKIKGVITENSLTGLWSGSDIAKNRVVISDGRENVIIDAGETDIASMIGRYAEVYCKYDDDKGLSVCIYCDVSGTKNDITEIDLFDIDYDASDGSRISYYDNGKEYKIKYNSKTAIIYNGTYYSAAGSVLDKINGCEGKFTVIDNDSNGIADVFNIEAYDTFIVNSVVLSTKTVFFKNTAKALSLDEEDYDQFSLKDEDGNDFYIEDFVDGTVVSVAQNSDSADKRTVKVLVCEQTVNGMVTAASQNDFGMEVIRLDNLEDYTLLKNVAVPNLGQGVIIALNAFGRVVRIDYSNLGEFAYGIITRVTKNRRENSVDIRMITAQNTIETFEVTSKLIVDRTTYRDIDALYAKLDRQDNISVGNQKLPAGVYPVRYKLRSGGTLAEIDTDKRDGAAGENENTLQFFDSGYRMLQTELVMGGIFALKSSTPVFRISGSTSESIIEKDYFEDTKYTAMSNVSSLMSAAHKYNYAAYKVDKDSLYADFVIISSTWGQSYEDKLFVIEKVTTAYDEESGSVVKCVYGVENGVEKQLLVSDLYVNEFDEIGLTCGDVIRCKTDGYDHLIYVEDVGGSGWVVKHKLSDPSSKTIDINNISSGRTNLSDFRDEAYSTQMIFGYVKERRGNFVTLAIIQPNTHNLDGKRTSTDMEKETVLIKIPDNAAITVYDPTKQDKVFAATYDEILDYKHNGSNCSLMAIHFRTGRFMDAVVLNDYSLYKD